MPQSSVSRDELTRMFVLDAIADDYEDLEQIAKHVRSLGTRSGLTVSAPEILQALSNLTKMGLVQAYALHTDGRPPEEIRGMLPLEQVGNYHFWVTQEGRELQMSDYEAWPFDEAGSLKKDWSPPKNQE